MSLDLTGNVFVLRGLPGVGKTTFARELVEAHSWNTTSEEDHLKPQILSSDDFFVGKDGVYTFDKLQIQDAHKWNFERYRKTVENKTPLIIIDNSNIKHYHYYHYIDYAQRHNYRASVIIIPHNDVSDNELSRRTPHGIDRGIIGKMRREFEWQI